MRKLIYLQTILLLGHDVGAQDTKNEAKPAVSVETPKVESLKTETAKSEPAKSEQPKVEPAKPTPWYEKINLRGYVQARYNRLFESNANLTCDQCDRSLGNNQGFSLRRTRLIFFGDIHERVFMYIQPDLASSVSTATGTSTLHFAQLRDAYFDLSLDADKEYRFRIGQSKVPFGFENMQSSQNRLPLDRADSFNSGLSNERDLGVMFYWAPKKIRELYRALPKIKGSGDYGVVGIGTYNGQTANRPELNNNLHHVARVTYPFEIGSQIFEPGLQGYFGESTIDNRTTGTSAAIASHASHLYADRRAGVSLVLYPKPFGVQMEALYGEGPEYDASTNTISVKPLYGGYATVSYRMTPWHQVLIPFFRVQYYKGGKKFETDARSYEVKELEVGIEWEPIPAFELTLGGAVSERRFEDAARRSNFQNGNQFRIQAQFNY